MRLTDAAIIAAAGAFAYHCYAKIRQVESALTTPDGQMIHLGGILDIATSEEDTEESKFRFGFNK